MKLFKSSQLWQVKFDSFNALSVFLLSYSILYFSDQAFSSRVNRDFNREVFNQMDRWHLCVHDWQSWQRLASKHLWIVSVPENVAFISWHQVQLRFDFSSNHESKLRWTVIKGLQFNSCLDDLLGQVHDLVFHSERFIDANGLYFTNISHSYLQRSREEVDRWATHAAWDDFTNLTRLFVVVISKLDKVRLLVFLSVVRGPLEVKLWEELYLLQCVELFEHVDLINDLCVLAVCTSRCWGAWKVHTFLVLDKGSGDVDLADIQLEQHLVSLTRFNA